MAVPHPASRIHTQGLHVEELEKDAAKALQLGDVPPLSSKDDAQLKLRTSGSAASAAEAASTAPIFTAL